MQPMLRSTAPNARDATASAPDSFRYGWHTLFRQIVTEYRHTQDGVYGEPILRSQGGNPLGLCAPRVRRHVQEVTDVGWRDLEGEGYVTAADFRERCTQGCQCVLRLVFPHLVKQAFTQPGKVAGACHGHHRR